MRFAVDYLAGRRFDDLTKKGERDDRLLRLHDAGLRPDADPPTFPAWP
jgi:hypothetical protein